MLVVPAIWLIHRAGDRSESGKPQGKSNPATVTPLNLALLLLTIMVLLSLWTTYDLAYSFEKIAGIVFGLGVYFGITRLASTERGFWISMGVFVGCGLVLSGAGALGTDWASLTKIAALTNFASNLPVVFRGLQGAESGFNSNEVAGTLLWVITPSFFLVLVLLRTLRGSNSILKKIGIGVVGLLLIMCISTMTAILVLTQSREAYISLLITFLSLFFLAVPNKLKWPFIGLGLGLGLLSLGGTYLSLHQSEVVQWFISSGLRNNPAFSLHSLEIREAIWDNAVKGIQDFPYTGMGMNTFRKLMGVLYQNPLTSSYVDVGHAHNEFLQAGLDLGIPGMIAFISLYIGAFWMLVRTWKASFLLKMADSKGHEGSLADAILLRSLVLGLGGGLLAHLLFGLVDAVALGAKPGFVFWMLLGLITGLFTLVQKSVAQVLVDESASTPGVA